MHVHYRRFMFGGLTVVLLAAAVVASLPSSPEARTRSAAGNTLAPATVAIGPEHIEYRERIQQMTGRSGPREPRLARIYGVLSDPDTDDKAMRRRMGEAYFELVQLLATDPTLALDMEAALASADADELFAQVGVAALAGCGRDEAQHVLMRLVDARASDLELMRLIVPAMGFAEQPSAAFVDGLRRIGDGQERGELRDMAVLSLGVIGGRMDGAQPERSAAITMALEERLATTTDVEDARTYLGALGNVGTDAAAAVLGRFVHDENPGIRAKAIEAMRRTPGGGAEAIVARALGTDPDASVRSAAVWVMSQRHPTEAGLMMQSAALAGERDETVAMALLENLWEARSSHRALVATSLARLALSHPLETVRDLARARAAELSGG